MLFNFNLVLMIIALLLFILIIYLGYLNFNKYKLLNSINFDNKTETKKDKVKKLDSNVCRECGNKLKKDSTICEECGYDNKVKFNKFGVLKNKKVIIPICIIVFIVLGYFVAVDVLNLNLPTASTIFDSKASKYEDAVNLFNNKDYSSAKEKFEELEDYNSSDIYLKFIEVIDDLENQKYEEAYELYNSINDTSIEVDYLKDYVNTAYWYNSGDIKSIYDEYHNILNNKFYFDDNHKSLAIDAVYQYGVQMKNEGKLATAKECLKAVNGYKDSNELLEYKYFDLIGNNYSYTVQSGYTYGYFSILFYEYSDTAYIMANYGSIFGITADTNGLERNVIIKDDKIYLENYETFTIVSFTGDKLVLKTARGSKMELVKR